MLPSRQQSEIHRGPLPYVKHVRWTRREKRLDEFPNRENRLTCCLATIRPRVIAARDPRPPFPGAEIKQHQFRVRLRHRREIVVLIRCREISLWIYLCSASPTPPHFSAYRIPTTS